jgi:hypothetical protein
MSSAILDQVRSLAMTLSPEEQQQLIVDLQNQLQAGRKKPGFRMRGALADLEPVPSVEDIAEIRREMWRNFPREEPCP